MVDCGPCSECCKGPNRSLEISAETAKKYRSYRVHKMGGGVRHYLARKPNEDCHYLADDGCSIYADRPDVCRAFDCRDHIATADLHERILVQARARV